MSRQPWLSGGDGASGGSGGEVNVKNEGTITTLGASAHGIMAQSIGGGGGQGGVSFAQATNATNIAATVGGSGGTGNTGGPVGILNLGTVATEGNAAYGLYAQSIGGGGGTGVGASVDSQVNKGLTLNLNVGGRGGVGAHGGDVTIENRGTVATAGIEAHAVVAQSIGGGGGSFAAPAGDDAADDGTTKDGSGATPRVAPRMTRRAMPRR